MMSGYFVRGQNSGRAQRLARMVVLFQILEARLANKYGGLKWWDIDEANDDEEGGIARKGARKKKKNEPVKTISTAHPTKMYFHPGGKGEGKTAMR